MTRFASGESSATPDLIRALTSAFDDAEQALQRRLDEAAAEIQRLQPLGTKVTELEAGLQDASARLAEALAQWAAEREDIQRQRTAAEAAAAQAAQELGSLQEELARLESTAAAERAAAHQSLTQEAQRRSDLLRAAADEAAARTASIERLQLDLDRSRLAEADLNRALAEATGRAEGAERKLTLLQSAYETLSGRLDAEVAARIQDRSEWAQLIAGLRDSLEGQRLALAGSAQHAAALGSALEAATADRDALVATLRSQLTEAHSAARTELASWRALHDRACRDWQALSAAQQARTSEVERAAHERDELARARINALAERAEQAEHQRARLQRHLVDLEQERDGLTARCEQLQGEALAIQQALENARETWRVSAASQQAEHTQTLQAAAAKQAGADAEVARLTQDLQIAWTTLKDREADLQQERARSLSHRLQAAQAAERANKRRKRALSLALRRRTSLNRARALLARIATSTPWYGGARAREVAASFQSPARSTGQQPPAMAADSHLPQEVDVMSQQTSATAVMAETAPAQVPSIAHLLTLHDEDFVRNAYRAVLGREVDASGLANYAGQLRQGAERAQILCELALSPEGRAVVERSAGLDDLLRDPRRRPSWLARGLEIVLRPALRPLMARMNALDNHIGGRHQEMDHRLRALESQISHTSADMSRRLDGVMRSLQGLTDAVGRSVVSQTPAAQPAPAAPPAAAAAVADVDVLMENVRAELARIRFR